MVSRILRNKTWLITWIFTRKQRGLYQGMANMYVTLNHVSSYRILIFLVDYLAWVRIIVDISRLHINSIVRCWYWWTLGWLAEWCFRLVRNVSQIPRTPLIYFSFKADGISCSGTPKLILIHIQHNNYYARYQCSHSPSYWCSGK